MRWSVEVGDILDTPADVLVCSANVFLNLSGGVGGAFLLRYGPEMQCALHEYLQERGIRHIHRGAVVSMPPCGSPYRVVLHAVAVDASYESSSAVVTSVVQQCLSDASKVGARIVALPALATGYGELLVRDFISGVQPLLKVAFPPVEEVRIVVRSSDDAQAISASLSVLS